MKLNPIAIFEILLTLLNKISVGKLINCYFFEIGQIYAFPHIVITPLIFPFDFITLMSKLFF